MTKNGALSDFVREAIREKATRELNALNQQSGAFGGIERARDALFTLANDLASTTVAVSAISSDNSVSAKIKKLRKLVDDAHVLATEVADVLGVDAQREAVESSRQSILEALKAAGIDLDTVHDPART